MKDYTVAKEFWRNGIVQPVGSVIRMAASEAKYLAHALEEKAVEVEQKVEVAVKRARDRKPNTVTVVEASADGDDVSN
ncbi:hypothetical protein ACTG4Q_20595 [Bradyrhizobium denitrificans]